MPDYSTPSRNTMLRVEPATQLWFSRQSVETKRTSLGNVFFHRSRGDQHHCADLRMRIAVHPAEHECGSNARSHLVRHCSETEHDLIELVRSIRRPGFIVVVMILQFNRDAVLPCTFLPVVVDEYMPGGSTKIRLRVLDGGPVRALQNAQKRLLQQVLSAFRGRNPAT